MPLPNIIQLKNANVEPTNYFVDANVWIYSLQQFDTLAGWEDDYYQFFFDIVESPLNPKLLMPTLLLSEIVNTFLRKIAMVEFRDSLQPLPQSFEFKRDYRPTAHFRQKYEQMMDDIHSLRNSIRFVDDGIISKKGSLLLDKCIGNFDYNDFLYHNFCCDFCKQEKLTMLTNDGDFYVSEYNIVTSNRKLLK